MRSMSTRIRQPDFLNPLEEELALPILLADRIKKSSEESDSFKLECAEVAKRVEKLAHMLRVTAKLATATPFIYEIPIRRIASETLKNLDRALTLVRKCKRSGVLRRVVTITSAADFKKLFSLLDASLGDLTWLLNVYTAEGGGGINLGLPPIANTDPMLAWVWSYIAVLQMGELNDKIEAANYLASLAVDNDRNKQIIMDEGGVPPLLKLLKEASSADAQIAAAIVLKNLATDRDRVRYLANNFAVSITVSILLDAPMRVQIPVAFLAARMAEHDPDSQEEFARENAIRPLVSILSFETFDDDWNKAFGDRPTSIHSLVQIKKEIGGVLKSTHSSNSLHSEGSSRGKDHHHHRKERDNESQEVKLELKVNCAEALWMLARGSVLNSRRITETKGLLCLAKIIEKDRGELQLNCLKTVMEIASAAELNADLRRSAFKTNSPAAKAVIDQLLRVVQDIGNPILQIPAIKSIGCLARTFPARETQVVRPLVSQLGHRNPDVAAEAAAALGKFASPDNFLCVEHSKAIIEFDGVPPLVRLLRSSENAQLHGLILLCYLALHVGNSEALEQARALTALELAGRSMVAQHPALRELLPKAIYSLELYQPGMNPHGQLFAL